MSSGNLMCLLFIISMVVIVKIRKEIAQFYGLPASTAVFLSTTPNADATSTAVNRMNTARERM